MTKYRHTRVPHFIIALLGCMIILIGHDSFFAVMIGGFIATLAAQWE